MIGIIIFLVVLILGIAIRKHMLWNDLELTSRHGALVFM